MGDAQDEIPEDIWEAACLAWDSTQLTGREMVARAIMAERERCILIMYAEREWGNDLVEACERIEKGQLPRAIPGWNAPSED